ncbi:PREDICTED: SAC3 family protein A-like [Camelina sativa]|uniref:SAC3 family protein A-like n=1 Tax=Camelina sativa TaxID=90675 RepID=A0ABM0Z1A5_CAMSA|nr:PREDICTED: SAC3 family protein A-like [Camelina sativa]
MNQGGNTQAVAPMDPNSIENRYGVDGSQVHKYSYQYSTGSDSAPWTGHSAEHQAVDNGNYSNSNYYHPQPTGPATSNVQEIPTTASFTSSSTSGTANVAQDYSGYTPYQTPSDPHNYSNTGYSNYYSAYQPQPSQSYPQPVGAYQNTGAPQPLSSFQNPGSYAGTASYSGTYYNPADYQTAGGYQSTNYNNQTAGSYPSTNYSNQTPASNYSNQTPASNYSNQTPASSYSNQTPVSNYSNQTPASNYSNPTPASNYSNQTPASNYSNPTPASNQGNYTSNPYQNYTPDAANTHSSTIATATPVHHQQNYQQWSEYYSQTEVPCAPGTENLSATSAYSQSFPVPGVTSEMPASNSQPAPSYVQHWGPETGPSQPPSQQHGAAVSTSNDPYWVHQTQSLQAHHHVPPQNHYQSPLEMKPLYETPFQGHQRATYPQELNSQSSFHQPPLGYRQPTQTTPSVDTQRVSKVQIPTNPRIASNLPSGFTKMDKDSSAAGAAQTPAYVSVSMPKSKDHATAMPEPRQFPKSLRGYVERALARCKDDKEKASCQAALAEIIKNAKADETLYTRDWDTEPLSTVLNTNVTNTESSSTLISSFQNKSPTRRPKSRWEPLLEEKPFVKPASTFSSPVKFGAWNHQNENNKKNSEIFQKVDAAIGFKPTYSGQNSAKKSFQRPVKRQRFSGGAATAIDDEASSDSDKDLTPYYSSAVALASSAEEKKRRDSRSKRFERVQGHNRGTDLPKPKNANVGNLHSRRATALRLSKTFDESGSRAVEDIDWDALTVKGTCQEIEKRYLRLTSAPDPATVRPEDVLEKALLMVQDSQKNYLYKCDQLKSIRQDLTVQRIHNHLTAKVYETHARLALEAGDLPEYNQCLSQLKTLYAEGIEGCSLEFAAYSLLYITLHSNNNRELLSSMSRLSEEAKKDEAVRHALSVRAAVTSGNYVMFFRLYKTAPNMNSCLMDLYVEKMRYKAVTFMSRSCRPTIPVSYIVQVLGFTGAASEGTDEKETNGLEECLEWLKTHGANLITESNGDILLDTKASSTSLFMPEPEDAVAHGDRNLDVNDFFTRT